MSSDRALTVALAMVAGRLERMLACATMGELQNQVVEAHRMVLEMQSVDAKINSKG